MKRFALGLALLGLVALGAPATAIIGTVDDVPAASLLLPYFEVDLNSPTGITTLFSINNASASAAVAHVTIWSDLSVPVIDFDVYLTGYDVQTINLRDIIVSGILPRTADDGADPADTISPQGPFSQDINFPGASGPCVAPYVNPVITGNFLTYVQRALTGLGAAPATGSGSRCYGVPYGDGIARGYVTIDSVTQCSLLFPGDVGYFEGGIPDFRNILWGDYFYVEPGQNFAQGETLVHLEADAQFFVPGDYTFYGRYVGFTGIDGREPLASSFASRYVNGGAFDGGTEFIVWRDTKQAQNDFACAAFPPSPFPLNETQVMAFDEAEDATELCYIFGGGVISPPSDPEDPTCFPWEAGRYAMEGDLASPYDFGWLYMNLNFFNAAAPEVGAQAWVTTVMKAEGRYAVGFDAIPLDNAYSNPQNVLIGGLHS